MTEPQIVIGKHVPSLLPAEGRWNLVWQDEFDGSALDRAKWDFRLHLMQQRHTTFTDDAIELDGNSHLLLRLCERNGHFYTSQLQTGSNYMDRPGAAYGKFTWPIAAIQPPKLMHRYGYYEIRCKLPTQPGWWVAFWLQSPVIGSTLNPAESGVEVVIMENRDRDGTVAHKNHWNGYGPDHRSVASGARRLSDTPGGWHVFGLLWTEAGYVYYIDGKESWRVDGPVSHRDQFIMLSAECSGYRDGNAPSEELRRAVLPDAFVVDYVRVFAPVK